MLRVRVSNDAYNLEKRFKVASRGFVIKNNKIAILYSRKYNAYITPGGGVEKGESLEEACIREVKEETGYVVNTIKQIAILDCDYPKARIEHNYFVCELVRETAELNKTSHEIDQDLEVKWLSLEELKAAYANKVDSFKYDIWMQRESIVIPELRDYIKK